MPGAPTSTRAPSPSGESWPASATTAGRASRAAAAAASTARTCTGRCFPATPGSPTTSWRSRSLTARAESRRRSTRCRTTWSKRRIESQRRAHGRAAGGSRCLASTGPQRAEVDGGVARLPAREEALDRRVEHDLLQFLEREEPCRAYRLVLRLHVLERATRDVGPEDDVDDVLLRQ